MAAIENTIMKADVAQIRALDFNYQFTGNLNALIDALGVTRKIAVQEGAALKALKVVGELESGTVAEGEIIPLSKYEVEEVALAEAVLGKWRKSTTAEAIIKGGYDQAVGATTDKMVRDIQKGIRRDLIAYMANGAAKATGAGVQAALANGWAVMQGLWEDDAIEAVYFMNPLDAATYLGSAQVSMQTAFGMNYLENFLGLGTVFFNSSVPKGTFYATAKENIVLYFVNVASGDIASAFNLVTDETGYVGIHEYADNDRACVNDLVLSGVTFFPERIDGIVVGTIS